MYRSLESTILLGNTVIAVCFSARMAAELTAQLNQSQREHDALAAIGKCSAVDEHIRAGVSLLLAGAA